MWARCPLSLGPLLTVVPKDRHQYHITETGAVSGFRINQRQFIADEERCPKSEHFITQMKLMGHKLLFIYFGGGGRHKLLPFVSLFPLVPKLNQRHMQQKDAGKAVIFLTRVFKYTPKCNYRKYGLTSYRMLYLMRLQNLPAVQLFKGSVECAVYTFTGEAGQHDSKWFRS